MTCIDPHSIERRTGNYIKYLPVVCVCVCVCIHTLLVQLYRAKYSISKQCDILDQLIKLLSGNICVCMCTYIVNW